MRKLVSLALLCLASAVQAVPATVTITGAVRTPDGVALSKGTISCALSQVGTADGDVVASSTAWTLTAGAMPAGAQLVPNDIITPSGTVYRCTYSAVLWNGRPATWAETWRLASSPSTIAIGAITRVAQPGAATFVAGPAGPTGATGAAGPAGSPGVVSASAPVTYNAGTQAVGFDASQLDASLATSKSAAAGAVARTFAARLGDVVNVKDFGAVGNGVADDSDFIQAAIDSFGGAAAHRGGPTYLPPGTYKTTKPIIIRSGTRLIGAGAPTSLGTGVSVATKILASPGSGQAALQTEVGVNVQGFSIQDLAIVGGTGANVSIGIKFVGASVFSVDRVYLNAFHTGMYVEASADGSFNNVVQDTCSVYGVEILAVSRFLKFNNSLFANIAGSGYLYGQPSANIFILGGSHDIAFHGTHIDEAFSTSNQQYVASALVLDADRITFSDMQIFATGGNAGAGYKGYGIRLGDGTTNPTNARLRNITILPFGAAVPTYRLEVNGTGHVLQDVTTVMTNGGGGINMVSTDAVQWNVNGTYALPNLPTVAPTAGSKGLWADPADSYRVKLAN